MKYRWATPHEWLASEMERWDAQKLRWALWELSRELDDDTIQDAFQEDMDETGYFEPQTEEG